MSALSDATRALASTLKTVAGEPVIYSQGASTLSGVTGVPDAQVYEVMDSNGFMVSINSYDWLFCAADLTLNGSLIEPRQRDRITATLNGVSTEFEVMPVGTRPCVEAADADGIMVVVHSKKLANA